MLRRGSRPERRLVAAAGAAGANRNRTRQMGPIPVLLSEQGDAEAARYHRGACGAGQIHRHASAARQRSCTETHEARGQRRHLPQASGKDPANDPRRGDSDQHDRRLSGRNRSGFQRIVPVCRGCSVRPHGSLFLLRRRHQQEFRAGRQSGWPHHSESQTQADGDSAQDFPSTQSDAGRSRRWTYS